MSKVPICVGLMLASALATAQTLNDASLVVEPYTAPGTLSQPTCMAFIAPGDILVNEKGGLVRRVINGVVQPGNVLDLPVNTMSERGLLGMVLDPDFAINKRVYLYYTVAATDEATPIANRVSRYTWSGSALVFDHAIIDLPYDAGPNHDGGVLAFGPPTLPAAQQKLYIIIGDLNRSGQLQNRSTGDAPDNTSAIIRLNSDGTIPSGADKGPFFDVAGTNESLKSLYAYGIRNSFGMDFDPITGSLWDSENGPSNNDEVNLINPAFNSGWNRVMGQVAGENPANMVQFSGVGTYSNPEFSWFDVVAPTAIHFYRAAALGSAYQNDCFVGSNNNNGRLYHFEMNPGRTGFQFVDSYLADNELDSGESDSPIRFGQDFGAITDVETGPDGNLYVTSISNGTIYRIRPLSAAFAEYWELYD